MQFKQDFIHFFKLIMTLLNFIKEFENFSSFLINFTDFKVAIQAKVIVTVIIVTIVIIITISCFIILKITKVLV